MSESAGATPETSARPLDPLLAEVLDGLRAPQPTLPCKLFYDEQGSKIYEEITRLEEYYPFQAEIAILRGHGEAIAGAVGEGALVVEYGSGSSDKTTLLLDALHGCAGYVPIDISGEHLREAAAGIAARYPSLPVLPLNADFTGKVTLPRAIPPHARRLAFFPGSTIGNFPPPEATALLARIRALAGGEGCLLIGVDIPKDRATLELAYDDPHGVTARFNRNMLVHLNRLFDGDIDPGAFAHEAVWNAEESRIEMHLRARSEQRFTLAGEALRIAAGQSIWTESSYKYAPERFRAIAAAAGFVADRTWFDDARRYSLHLMRAG